MNYKEKDIQYLDTLPHRGAKNSFPNNRFRYHSYYGKIKHEHRSIWKIIDYSLERFIGKSVDLAFSYYTKLTKGSYYEDFWDTFNNPWKHDPFFIDDNKIIRTNKPRIRSLRAGRGLEDRYVYYSPNYKIEYVWYDKFNKEVNYTDKVFNRLRWKSDQTKKSLGYYVKPKVIVGYKIVFDYATREYKKFIAEKRSFERKKAREQAKIKKEQTYSFLTKSEKNKIISLEEDVINRDRHGFNEESFKYAPYHGKQRKKKKKEIIKRKI